MSKFTLRFWDKGQSSSLLWTQMWAELSTDPLSLVALQV